MKNKNYPTTDTRDLKQTISQQKSIIRRLRKEKEQLKSELKTLKDALNSSIEYINEQLEGIPVEDIVRYFNRKKKGKLDDVKKVGRPKKADKERDREETIKKFQSWIKRKNQQRSEGDDID